jgi:Putative MetA-pathway of phenol degradation
VKLLLLIGIFFALISPALSQSADLVNSDRPSFSTSTHIVPARHVQLEGGDTRARYGPSTSNVFGELLVRIGVSERIEVRAGIPSYISIEDSTSRVSGADDSLVEGKFLLKSGSRLSLGALASAVLPTGSHSVAEHSFRPRSTFIADINVSKSVSVTSNASYARSTSNGVRFNDVSGVSTANFALPSNLGLFTEFYAFNQLGGRAQKYAASGFEWTIGKYLEIDASGGFGIRNGAHGPDRYYGAGISRLF